MTSPVLLASLKAPLLSLQSRPLVGFVADASVPSTGLDLPGTSGNYASTPDSADLDLTTEFAAMADLALDDWTPASRVVCVGKLDATNGGTSYGLLVELTSGVLRLGIGDGTSSAVNSDTAPTVSDGGFLCVGVTWRESDDRVQFWTAATGTTTGVGGVGWTQLGADRTLAKSTIANTTVVASIGALSTGTAFLLAGNVKRARVWADVACTDERLDANFVGVDVTGTRTPATVTDAAKGATITINGSGWDWST